jgi:hypothetical protein
LPPKFNALAYKNINHLRSYSSIFNDKALRVLLTSANFGTLMDTEVFSVDILVEASVPLDSLEEASNESFRVSGLEEP